MNHSQLAVSHDNYYNRWRTSVETIYQPEYSNPANDHYMFAYKISIENVGHTTVQLLRRHRKIFDSNGAKREVEGEGVVGQQPIIEPGSTHEYVLGSKSADMGSMKGEYQMARLMDNNIFNVHVRAIQNELVLPKYKRSSQLPVCAGFFS